MTEAFQWKNSISKSLRKTVGRAIGDFCMIDEGDKILLGLSGGKDSLVLLHALSEFRRRSPASFSLLACTVAIAGGSAPEVDLSNLEAYCAARDVPYIVIRHPIIEILEARSERSPCSFCANMRRGILSGCAREHGCRKLALGHSLDDAIETFYLNILRGGRARSFRPKFFQDRTEIDIIRPLIYAREQAVIDEAARLSLPVLPTNCPYAGKTERQRVKGLLEDVSKLFPDVYRNTLSALKKLSDNDRWGVETNESARN
ncbi:tRNA 2-thiocytidine(32) synthetase TtcA [Synergistales bacterium]|nr:tRNA 2-thiocytidine(32) synthetase TtcA [Synergistales bacterium]